QQFDKVADGFTSALEELRNSAAAAQGAVSPAEHAGLNQECRIAEAVAIHFRSVANQSRFVVARRALTAAKTQAESTKQVAIRENEGTLRGNPHHETKQQTNHEKHIRNSRWRGDAGSGL